MIVVTPNGKNAYDGCQYTNSYVIGNWENYIVQDVVQHVESNFHALMQRDSRGLSGYSMGGHGTIMIAMKHPSLYGSIVLIAAPGLDFEVTLNEGDPPRKNYIIDAANIGEYRPQDPREIRGNFSMAAAYSPDSTAKPSLCRLPYTADGVRIDSIWQKWLMHDPASLLPAYKDSLLKLNSIQI
jgi:S-formylglutathione hydrolase FrmB